MRARSLFVFLSLVASVAFAQGPRLRTRPEGPPALPLPAPLALRGDMVQPQQWHRVAQDTSGPTQETVQLPLSAGLAMISLPVRTGSQLLSDILQNLPNGSRVWTWDPLRKQFVEGFDQELRFGDGALLYLPSPAIVTVTGTTDDTEQVPVNLQNGWNLVGVPFDVPLLRSSQYVYVGGLPTAFNDAVDSGDLGPDVFSLDSRGQQSVGDSDSLQPMNAYWVYSNDAELLELQPSQAPPLLGSNATDVTATPVDWTAAKAFLTVAQFAASQYIAKRNRDATAAQLASIAAEIQYVQKTQQTIIQTLTRLSSQIDFALNATLLGQSEKVINGIQSQILTSYDGTLDPDQPPAAGSFMWFIRPDATITDDEKYAFDQRVLDPLNGFIPKFNNIYLEVTTGANGGMFDNYANVVILSDPGDAKNKMETRYKRMEEYFKDVIGMQIKCMLMITNAYNDIWQNPANPKRDPSKAGEAVTFYNGTYIPAIKKEINQYKAAVEKVLAGSLIIAKNPYQPSVAIPAVVQDTIMPSADYLTMVLLGEPGGVRLRVLVSPDMNVNNPYRVRTVPPGFIDFSTFLFPRSCFICPSLPSAQDPVAPYPLPPTTDSTNWTDIAGKTNYDSWKIDPEPSNPKFFLRSGWKMYRTPQFPLPLPASGTSTRRFELWAVDAWRITDGLRSLITYGYVDDSGKYSTTGKTLFGSAVIATRASASSILNIAPANLGGRRCGTTNWNFIGFKDCLTTDRFKVSQKVEFTYGGGGQNGQADANWKMGILSTRTGNGVNGTTYINLTDDNSNILASFVSDITGFASMKDPKLVTFYDNRKYALEMGVNYSQSCKTFYGSQKVTCYATEQNVTRGPEIIQFIEQPAPGQSLTPSTPQ